MTHKFLVSRSFQLRKTLEMNGEGALRTRRWSSTACATSIRYFGVCREDNLRAVDSFSTIDLIYLHLVLPFDSFTFFFPSSYIYTSIRIYTFVSIQSLEFGTWQVNSMVITDTHMDTHTHTQARVFVLGEIFFSFFLSFVNFIGFGFFFFCSLTNQMESICWSLLLSWWVGTDSCSICDHVISATKLIDKKIIQWKTLPTILINLLVAIDRIPFCFLECHRYCHCPI